MRINVLSEKTSRVAMKEQEPGSMAPKRNSLNRWQACAAISERRTRCSPQLFAWFWVCGNVDRVECVTHVHNKFVCVDRWAWWSWKWDGRRGRYEVKGWWEEVWSSTMRVPVRSNVARWSWKWGDFQCIWHLAFRRFALCSCRAESEKQKKTVKGTSAAYFLQDHSAAVVFPHGDTTSGGLSLVFFGCRSCATSDSVFLCLSFGIHHGVMLPCTPTFSCSCARYSSYSAATMLRLGERASLVTCGRPWCEVLRSKLRHHWRFGAQTARMRPWFGLMSLPLRADTSPKPVSHLSAPTPSNSPSRTTLFEVCSHFAPPVKKTNTHTRTRGKRYKIEVPSTEPPRTAEWQRPELRSLRRKTGAVSNMNFQPHTIEVHAACAVTTPATICSLRCWATRSRAHLGDRISRRARTASPSFFEQ